MDNVKSHIINLDITSFHSHLFFSTQISPTCVNFVRCKIANKTNAPQHLQYRYFSTYNDYIDTVKRKVSRNLGQC